MLYVTKRNGQTENVHFDKITERINKLIYQDEPLDPVLVAQKVVASLYPGITTEELDIESANICVNLSTIHPLYASLKVTFKSIIISSELLELLELK